MGRRRKKCGSPNANVTASTPDLVIKKKQRCDDRASTKTSVMSQHASSAISESGTAVNDSNMNGFGDVPDSQPPIATKISPLMVKSIGIDKLKQAKKVIEVNASYKMCRVRIKTVLTSKEDYQKAMLYLDRMKAEYFTFNTPSEKPFKAVIRGLPVIDVADIKSDLEYRIKLTPLAVFSMKRHNKKIEYRDCLYLVHFKKGTVSLGALKAARVIHDVIVSWEGYRGTNKDVTQCMRF
ncbi:uncharacterized protein LOC131680684 [Topomyia yanbarensis]|uniref:uncharacterized protein LOC131680684 n=1 Tax=Topomyia yanbarensis TaxID=2498891 RepID=UPI00273B5550|nr:uncharacterized protein LOC131680684 [Topomyia yanbarensis]